jgi:Cu(I)/Ag(I) efflux system membrane fusion protein
MNTRRQLLLSAGIVGMALVGVGIYALTGREPSAGEQAGEHVHGAAAPAAGAASPVRLSAEAARRIGITYATVVRKPLRRPLELVGNVTYDETRLSNVNPKIEGWVEQLYVNFTGAPVRRGQPLMSVYSPMLVSAQEELILAKRLADESASGGGERASLNARDLLDAARRRLRYWDISEAEIAHIEQTGQPVRTLTLRAPASGVVVEKMVVEGARIMPGMDLYRIADLSTVWVEGEVFEKDLSLVHLGQTTVVSFDAYPGEAFMGRLTYIYPTLATSSRTGRVRVEIANPGQRLKPGMYARLALDASSTRDALLVPRTAIHFTGQRALAFVRHEDGTLMPHEVTTGFASGEFIEVLAGLTEGMQVVSSANFLIDAESNLGTALGSMPGMDMSPSAPPAAGGTSGPAGPSAPPRPAPGREGHSPTPAPAPDPHAAHKH